MTAAAICLDLLAFESFWWNKLLLLTIHKLQLTHTSDLALHLIVLRNLVGTPILLSQAVMHICEVIFFCGVIFICFHLYKAFLAFVSNWKSRWGWATIWLVSTTGWWHFGRSRRWFLFPVALLLQRLLPLFLQLLLTNMAEKVNVWSDWL